MKEKIRKVGKYLSIIIIGAIIFCIGAFNPFNLSSGWSLVLQQVGTAIAVGDLLFSKLLPSLVDLFSPSKWKVSLRKLLKSNELSKDTSIRISFAYLFRIFIDGQYFLILNDRHTGKYQPVGGVYKMKNAEFRYLKDNFFVETDDKIGVDPSSKLDYRLRLKADKLKSFVKRFNKTQERELSDNVTREFYEELIATGIVPEEDFQVLKYRFIGRHFTEITFGDHFQCYELLMADIYEIELTLQQEKDFAKLKLESTPKYRFVTEHEIQSLGIDPAKGLFQESIADHSKKILSSATGELEKVKGISKESIPAKISDRFSN